MPYCTKCGTELDEQYHFCMKCGTKVQRAEPIETDQSPSASTGGTDYSDSLLRFKSMVTEKATTISSKAAELGQTATSGINHAIEKGQQAYQAQVHPATGVAASDRLSNDAIDLTRPINVQTNEPAPAPIAEPTPIAEPEVETPVFTDSSKREVELARREAARLHLTKCTLWSFLKKDAKKQRYFTEEVSEMTPDEFARKVDEKLLDNQVPAEVFNKQILWDGNTNSSETILEIRPSVSIQNPMTFFVQFNHVGKFTFVEEQSYITPPDLPKVPGTKRTYDGKAAGPSLLIGLLLLLLALLGGTVHIGGLLVFLLVILGFGLIVYAVYLLAEIDNVRTHNDAVDREIAAWDAAWTKWENENFTYAYQEGINGRLTRISDAVFECIKQVCEEEFGNAGTSTIDESAKMSELESLIANRKKDYR